MIRRQPETENLETKSSTQMFNPSDPRSFMEFLERVGGEFQNVLAAESIEYYEKVGPVATAVDKIAESFGSLNLSVFDKATEEWDHDHDVIRFLDNPNADCTRQEFLKGTAAFFLITGNTFWVDTGLINRPPLEIFVIPPPTLTIQEDPTDGFPDVFQISHSGLVGMGARGETFKRVDKPTSKFRFVDPTEGKELWQIREFNPSSTSRKLWGRSKLASIFYEIEQYSSSSIHNLSLLKNGARLSAALLVNGILTDDQFKRLQQQVDQYYAGAHNAGKMIIVENGADGATTGGGSNVKELSVTPKDMDFRELRQDNRWEIFNRLNIPIPLISPEAMTLNNFQAAEVIFWKEAVLPVADKLLEELTLFIGARFGLSESQIITYDPSEINALQIERNEEVLLRSKIGANTDNELRTRLGDEGYTGGDTVYKPATLIPVGTDANTDQERAEPTRQKFITLIQSAYPEMDTKAIEKIADEEGLEGGEDKGLREP